MDYYYDIINEFNYFNSSVLEVFKIILSGGYVDIDIEGLDNLNIDDSSLISNMKENPKIKSILEEYNIDINELMNKIVYEVKNECRSNNINRINIITITKLAHKVANDMCTSHIKNDTESDMENYIENDMENDIENDIKSDLEKDYNKYHDITFEENNNNKKRRYE